MNIAMAIGLAISPVVSLQGVTIVDGPTADARGLAAEYGSGVCRVSVFGKDNNGAELRAEFSRRLRDGNFSVSLYGPFIQKFRDADPDANYPVTLAYDANSGKPSRSGGYDVGGFREYAWGGWGPGPESDAAYGALRGTKSFTVSMNGASYGPFTGTETGAVWTAMDDCEADNS